MFSFAQKRENADSSSITDSDTLTTIQKSRRCYS